MYGMLRHMALAAVVSGALVATPGIGAQAADPLNYTGADREQFLIKGAKKEGAMTIYSALTINQALRPLVKGFMAKYPFLKVEYWRGSSRKIAQKVLAEMRASSLVADVMEGSGLAKPMVKARAVARFSTPATNTIPAKFRDKDSLWVPSRFSYFGTAYNTKLVPAGTQPKTWQDLLDPKWKGKIAWRAKSESGALLFITNLRLTMGEKKAEAYLKKLSKQGVINFSGSARTLVNRVVEGEYPIALNIFMHHPIISRKKGAPVDSQPMEPVPSINGTMMIPKGVKHPHAAMLFVDYYLSAEGQKVLRKARYFPVLPSVKPRKELERIVPRLSGARENFVSPAVLFKSRKKSQQLFKKYFR